MSVSRRGNKEGCRDVAPDDEEQQSMRIGKSSYLVSALLFCLASISPGCDMIVDDPITPQTRHEFEGRSYLLTATSKAPEGILLYLHGARKDPLAETAAVRELRTHALSRNYVVVQPRGSIDCNELGLNHHEPRVCWDLRNSRMELGYIDRLIRHVEEQVGEAFKERHVLGYSNGGFLMAAALQEGLVQAWSKVGIIAGGAVGNVRAPAVQAPPVYIEIGTGDEWQLEPSRLLRSYLGQLNPQPAYRETSDGHALSSARMRRFLSWWDASSSELPSASVTNPTPGVTP